jgi:lipoprotein-releasing system permease protein
MLLATVMVNGFTYEISRKIFGFWGHIHIHHFDNNNSFEDIPISRDQNFMPKLMQEPGVTHIAPYATKSGIIKTTDEIEGVVMKGIDATYPLEDIGSFLREGRLPVLDSAEASRDLLLSTTTARRLRIGVGDKVIVYFVRSDRPMPVGRRFEVCGLYNTGLEEYDRQFALADMRIVQQVNGWDSSEVSGFEVRLSNTDQIQAMGEKVYYEYIPKELYSETIYEMNPNIFEWLQLQKTNEYIILGLMLLVAILNMVTALLILILDRTRMIGLLKALGAGNGQLRAVFLYNAAFIVLQGLLLGNLIGIGLATLQKYGQMIKLPEESYYLSVAPVRFDWTEIAIINICCIVLCMLALLLPARIVAGISPLKAIRFS